MHHHTNKSAIIQPLNLSLSNPPGKIKFRHILTLNRHPLTMDANVPDIALIRRPRLHTPVRELTDMLGKIIRHNTLMTAPSSPR